jgi:hypothetical protein
MKAKAARVSGRTVRRTRRREKEEEVVVVAVGL